jgi:hypothetical protein
MNVLSQGDDDLKAPADQDNNANNANDANDLANTNDKEEEIDVVLMERAVELFEISKNIMVVTGAGISVSCGIPDFRSENGIYSRLSEFGLEEPEVRPICVPCNCLLKTRPSG